MEDFKIKFADAIRPAFITSLILIALTLIIQFLVNDLELQQYINYAVMVIELGLLIYFGIQYRETLAKGSLTYGQSFNYIFYLTIIVSVIVSIFYYINIKYIDPSILDKMMEAGREKLSEQGNLTDEQLDNAIEMQGKFMSTGWMAMWSLIGNIIFSVILSLVAAIFVKKINTKIIEE